jgi:Ras-related protein Rab-11B
MSPVQVRGAGPYFPPHFLPSTHPNKKGIVTGPNINSDFIFKIILAGAGGVGKTTLIHRYLTSEFLDDTKLTVGVSFQDRTIERFDRRVNVILYDLGGQDRFRFLQGPLIFGASAAFLCFEMTRFSTLADLEDWVTLVRENANPDVALILVGTKMDLIDDPERLQMINDEARQFATEHGLVGYFPTSAKSGENVDEVVNRLVDYLLYKNSDGQIGVDAPILPETTP